MGFWTLRKPHSAFEGKEGNVIYVAFSQHDRTIQHPQDLSNVVRSIHTPAQDSEPVPSLEELASSLPTQQDTLVASLASLPSAVARYQEGAAQYQRAAAQMQAAAVELQQIPGFQPAQQSWYSGLLRSYALWATVLSGAVAYAVADHLYPSIVAVLACTDIGMITDIAWRLDRRDEQQRASPSKPSSSTGAPSAYLQAQYPSRSTLS